jgi:hypothetical protein
MVIFALSLVISLGFDAIYLNMGAGIRHACQSIPLPAP